MLASVNHNLVRYERRRAVGGKAVSQFYIVETEQRVEPRPFAEERLARSTEMQG